MNERKRQLVLLLLLFLLHLRTSWFGLSWGLSGHLASAAARLSPLQPPLPSWPGLLGGIIYWIPLGNLHFRLNLLWIVFHLAALYACYRLLRLSMRSRPSLAFFPLLALAGTTPLWQRASPMDLGAPSGALVLWTLFFSLRGKNTPALLLAGLTAVAVPGGCWFAFPILVGLAFTWRGGAASLIRGLSLCLIGSSLLLFLPLTEGQIETSQILKTPWLALSVLLGGNETPWQQGMEHLLSSGRDLSLIPWYVMALLGAMMGRRRSLYPCLLLAALIAGPPGRAALGARIVVSLALLTFLSSRFLAWEGFPRLPWSFLLACATLLALAAGWRQAASRWKESPDWIVRDVFREADRRSSVFLQRVEVDFLLSGEMDCSGFRNDLIRNGPAHKAPPSALSSSPVRFVEAAGEIVDRCQGASTVRGLLFRQTREQGAPYLSASYAQFRNDWLRRSRTLDFHIDKHTGNVVAEHLLFVAEQLWRGREIFPALEELKLATSLAPTSSRVRLIYAKALGTAGNDMAAFRQRHLAFQYAPNDPQAVRRYALHLSRIRAHRQAIPLLRKARRAFPEDQTVITALGNSLVATGLPLEALALYREALSADPNNPYIHYNLGLLLFDREDYQEAADHASEAIKEGFNRERSHYLMAKIALKLENDEQAMDHLERAVKLDPTGQIAKTARLDEVFQPLRMYSRFERITLPGSSSSEARATPSP